MKRKAIVLVSILALAAGAALAGWFLAKRGDASSPASSAGAARASEEAYYCPMHPEFRSDRPGNCPICSMKLVKLESAPEGGPSSAGHEAHARGSPGAEATPSARTIFIAPQRQQLIGVRSVPAVVKPLAKELRLVGKVAYDETKLTHIHTKVTGYIEEVFVDFVGKPVKRGEPLFTIYSPELVSTQQEYLIALRGRQQLQESPYAEIASGANALVSAARERLRLWDIGEAEIEALEKEGKVKRALTIHSQVSGVVTERMAYHHGRYVSPEMDLYTIVDLSTVWVLGEVYEYELPHVKEGQAAEIEFPYTANPRSLRGQVTFIYPYLNPKTRTAQVRMEFPNPDLALRPEMFVNVKLRIPLGSQLVVPEDAVLDTGTEQYVFVDKGQGYFEPRAVKLGPEAEGLVAIESGLKAGEKVVTAANFILDSESRLKGALANLGAASAHEHGQAPTSSVRVDVLEPKEAKVGRNALRLRMRDSSGNAIEDAQVEVMLSMPQMGGMPPMSAKAMLQHQGKGEYAGQIEIPMAWTWQTTVTVRKGSTVLGNVQTTLTVR